MEGSMGTVPDFVVKDLAEGNRYIDNFIAIVNADHTDVIQVSRDQGCMMRNSIEHMRRALTAAEQRATIAEKAVMNELCTHRCPNKLENVLKQAEMDLEEESRFAALAQPRTGSQPPKIPFMCALCDQTAERGHAPDCTASTEPRTAGESQ
jgi:spore germination cell wall hydrolase CwlJ-like protein